MKIVGIQFFILFLAICSSVAHGKSPRKMLDGDEIQNAPFLAAIHDPLLSHRCGGAIIDATHILTAAHCIVDGIGEALLSNASWIIVGTTYIRNLARENLYKIASARVHEGYNASHSYHNDIGIIKVDGVIEFTKSRRPISLPVSEITTGTLVLAIGWGVTEYDPSILKAAPYSEILRGSFEQVISQGGCQAMISDEFIHPEHICTQSRTRAIPCYGDSGGPLVDPSSIVGIISFSQFCNRSYPTIYTRVDKYVEWINNVMKSS